MTDRETKSSRLSITGRSLRDLGSGLSADTQLWSARRLITLLILYPVVCVLFQSRARGE